tara:strand:- start:9678 stop:10010 length:333 start_codon:yes stop_codon:yes gene_type:complete
MKHNLFTLRGCPFELLNDEKLISDLLSQTAKECKSILINVATHKFLPHGVTGVALLSESHISIHTWPEKGVAICDIFTCGEHSNPQDGVSLMKMVLKASGVESDEITRLF